MIEAHEMGDANMDEYIQAWQCIGCGRIEAPQQCIGVCKDRKIFFVSKEAHDLVLKNNACLHERLKRAREMLLRFAYAKPRAEQWEVSWKALQDQVAGVRNLLDTSQALPHPEPRESG